MAGILLLKTLGSAARAIFKKKGLRWPGFYSYSMHIYIYMHAVELKTGPMFAFSSVKNWSIFLFFFVFLVLKISFSLQKEIFQKKKKKKQKQDPFLALKTGPILLHNILGPVFNASLDQFLTLVFVFLFLFFVCFFFGWNPYFYSVFSKNAKFKETQKRKKDTICEHNCANCSCQNVFSCIFHFCYFWKFHFFRDVFDWFPKIKKWQNTKARKRKQKQQQESKMQNKNKSNLMIRNKTRQQAEKRKTKEQLKRKSKYTERKSKNQKQKWKTGTKEERKEQERDKEREREKRGRSKKG